MKTNYLFMALIFALIVVGGCQFSIKSEPAVFRHEDEMVRKGDFVVLADRRIFATMAFLNAAGYDEEMEGKEMHPVRVRVREMLREKAVEFPNKFHEWKEFYENTRCGIWAYNDFALSLTTDYPFKRICPDNELGYPYTAQTLAHFPAVLNDFWETTDLGTIWAKVKPDYLAEIGQYDIDEMERTLPFIWQYLRMQRKDSYVFVHIPNLLDAYCQASGAGYEDYFFCVESLGNPKGFNVHEYLHTVVKDIVKEYYQQYANKLRAYYQAGEDGKLSKSYQEQITFTSECLVRALMRRMDILLTDDPGTKRMYESLAKQNSDLGLILIYPFFQCLNDFEKSNMPFDEFVPLLFERLSEYSK